VSGIGDEEDMRCSLTNTPDDGYCCQGNPADSPMVVGAQRGDGFNNSSMCVAKGGDECNKDQDPGTGSVAFGADYELCCDRRLKEWREGTQGNDDYGCAEEEESKDGENGSDNGGNGLCSLSNVPGEGMCCAGSPLDSPMIYGEKRSSVNPNINWGESCLRKMGDRCTSEEEMGPANMALCCNDDGRLEEGAQNNLDYGCVTNSGKDESEEKPEVKPCKKRKKNACKADDTCVWKKKKCKDNENASGMSECERTKPEMSLSDAKKSQLDLKKVAKKARGKNEKKPSKKNKKKYKKAKEAVEKIETTLKAIRAWKDRCEETDE